MGAGFPVNPIPFCALVHSWDLALHSLSDLQEQSRSSLVWCHVLEPKALGRPGKVSVASLSTSMGAAHPKAEQTQRAQHVDPGFLLQQPRDRTWKPFGSLHFAFPCKSDEAGWKIYFADKLNMFASSLQPQQGFVPGSRMFPVLTMWSEMGPPTPMSETHEKQGKSHGWTVSMTTAAPDITHGRPPRKARLCPSAFEFCTARVSRPAGVSSLAHTSR